MSEEKFYKETEEKLKTLLGDLWLEYKDDARDWAKSLARLEWAIAKGESPIANKMAYEHLTKIGIPCFVQKMRGRVEAEVINFVETFFQSLLNYAIAAGMAYFTGKITKL